MSCTVAILEIRGSWRNVADAARTTIHKDKGEGEPSSRWKRRMLLAEHSPIRQMSVRAKWSDLPSWVSVHFVRHKIGIEHWVRTQRSDRTGIDRALLPQGALVEHEILASFQAVITISRKRLCRQASVETREAWELLLGEIKSIEPELHRCCVPECVYRGWCPEYQSCGFHKSEKFQNDLKIYRGDINP